MKLFGRTFFEKIELRNLARSIILHENKTPKPVYTSWSLAKAVKEGYTKNSWVYRSIFLKSQAAGSVKWVVRDSEGSIITKHPINILMKKPFLQKMPMKY